MSTDILGYRDRDFIVILSVPRSGSTLLQGVLNAIPGYLIRGENHALMLSLFRACRALRLVRSQSSAPTTPEHPWYGAEQVDPKSFLRDTTAAFVRQLLGSRSGETFQAIGFKEVRWTARDLDDVHLWIYLKFIEEMFPKAKFILLTREVGDTLKSGWWPSFDRETSEADIEAFYLLARAAPVTNLFEVRYDQLVPDSDGLRGLMRFLGQPYSEAINATLGRPHSFTWSDPLSEVARSAKYIAELEAFRDTQKSELEHVRKELQNAIGELSRSSSYIADLEAFRDAQTAELDRLREELQSAVAELSRSGSYISNLESLRDAQTSELDRLRQELQATGGALSRSGSYIADLEAFRDAQKAELDRLRQELESAVDELSRSGSYIARLEAFRDSQTMELDRLREELQRSGSYIADLEIFREARTVELDRVREELQSAVAELSRSGSYIADLEAFRDARTVELDRLREELQSAIAELSHSGSYIADLEAFRDAQASELNRLRHELQTAVGVHSRNAS